MNEYNSFDKKFKLGGGDSLERERNCKLADSSVFDQSPFLSNARTDPCMTSKHRF